jgi:hypothetical protein
VDDGGSVFDFERSGRASSYDYGHSRGADCGGVAPVGVAVGAKGDG